MKLAFAVFYVLFALGFAAHVHAETKGKDTNVWLIAVTWPIWIGYRAADWAFEKP